jgi:hypothetical protein
MMSLKITSIFSYRLFIVHRNILLHLLCNNPAYYYFFYHFPWIAFKRPQSFNLWIMKIFFLSNSFILFFFLVLRIKSRAFYMLCKYFLLLFFFWLEVIMEIFHSISDLKEVGLSILLLIIAMLYAFNRQHFQVKRHLLHIILAWILSLLDIKF